MGTVSDEPNIPQDDATNSTLGFSWGLHPLALFIEPEVEGYDVGAGFIYEQVNLNNRSDPSSLMGAYLEGDYILWADGTRGEAGLWRLSAVGRGEALQDTGPQGDWGVGGSVGVLIEYIWWVESVVASADANLANGEGIFIGSYIGEGGFGLDVSTNFRDVGGQRYTSILASLNIRLPAAIGLLLIPIPLD